MEITTDFQERVISMNKNAMNIIKSNNYKTSLQLLKDSLNLLSLAKVCDLKFKLLAMTQNNLGCIYKRRKKPSTALKYLQQASESEKKAFIDNVARAGTHLNICAIFSSLNKHKKALEQSQKALDLLKVSEKTENFLTTLVIAYHNIAVEHEFLKDFKIALEFYKLAWETGDQELGSDHPLTLSSKTDFNKAEQVIQDLELSAIVKDIDKKEEHLRQISPRKEKVLNKAKKLQEKFEGFKEFPYLNSLKVKELNTKFKSINEKLKENEKFSAETHSSRFQGTIKQRTRSVCLNPGIQIVSLNTVVRKVGKNRVSTTRDRKKRIEALHVSVDQQQFLNSLVRTPGKPSSLRSKTILLLQELENLKIQAKQEKIIISNRETPTESFVNLAQAVVRGYLFRRQGES